MTEQEIERCLERLSSCKTADVINFDYAGTLAYIKRLQEENAELKDQWDNLRCVYSFDGDVMEYCVNGPCPHDRSVAKVREENDELKERLSQANEECLKWHERAQNLIKENCGSIFGYEKTIKELQSENVALRERLERAVEVPCLVGDTVFGVGFFDCEDAYTEDEKKKREIFHHCMKMNGNCEKCKFGHPSIEQFVCTHIQISACGLDGQKILIVGEKNENYTEKNIFLTREAAEARLAELKGENK